MSGSATREDRLRITPFRYEAITTIGAPTAQPRFPKYLSNLRFAPSYEVCPRTKSTLQPATANSFARNTTLPTRYPVESILGAVMHTSECGRRTCSVELQCAPVVAVVRARWSCCAHLLFWPSYALGGAAVRAFFVVGLAVVCARWSCCARLLLWPSYALGGAAVRACCGRRAHSVELLCVPHC